MGLDGVKQVTSDYPTGIDQREGDQRGARSSRAGRGLFPDREWHNGGVLLSSGRGGGYSRWDSPQSSAVVWPFPPRVVGVGKRSQQNHPSWFSPVISSWWVTRTRWGRRSTEVGRANRKHPCKAAFIRIVGREPCQTIKVHRCRPNG